MTDIKQEEAQLLKTKLPGALNTLQEPSGKHLPSTTAPLNVFSNDGGFLERFKAMKEDEEKRKKDEAIHRKQEFEDQIKNRGKRLRHRQHHNPPSPTDQDDSGASTPDTLVKRARPTDEDLPPDEIGSSEEDESQYLKERAQHRDSYSEESF